jgi:hypothetical protein
MDLRGPVYLFVLGIFSGFLGNEVFYKKMPTFFECGLYGNRIVYEIMLRLYDLKRQ